MQLSMKVVCWIATLVIAATLWSVAAHAQSVEADARQAAEEAAIDEERAGDPNPLAIDLDLAVWTVVIFVVLLLVLSKFAWPAIATALDERERQIADNIAAAAAKHEEAKKLLAEHEAKLVATAGEVRALLDEARRDAEVTKRRIEEDGRKAAADEVARAAREIERAKDNALHELAVTSANLAIELGRQVVRDQLETSPEHQARIVREALSKLATATASKN
jgi:F-type H+-transporting ATPase subunit b